MVRGVILAAAASLGVAACSNPSQVAAPDVPAVTAQSVGPATVVGRSGSTARVALPRLGPRAYAEIATRAIREPAETGGTERQVDSLCEIWADEGAHVGSIAGWTISGETSRMESANLRASVKTTALDAERAQFEVEASFR